MKVPLYILGFLMRYGPQHGYLLRQHVEREASDFAVIRTSNIYYHLERLKDQGFVQATVEREGRRPDRQVFRITDSGREHFLKLLHKATGDVFKGEYLFDAVLFFFEYIDGEKLIEKIAAHIDQCRDTLVYIRTHQQETVENIPGEYVGPANAVFNHHRYHYEAELKWLEEVQALFTNS